MKNLLLTGFLVLSSLAIVSQTATIADSKKASAPASVRSQKNTAPTRDLIYYRTLFIKSRKSC